MDIITSLQNLREAISIPTEVRDEIKMRIIIFMADQNITPQKNTGLILEPIPATDFMAGVNSPLGFAEILPDGVWTPYLSTREIQRGSRIEPMSCVSHAQNNSAESQIIRLMRLGLMPSWLRQKMLDAGYFDENGLPNLSDRFLAWASGTTKQGNSMNKVAETFRKMGAVPEKDWPFVNASWDEYYKEPPAHVIAKGKQFLEWFNIYYEWASTAFVNLSHQQLATHLRQAPLQIAIATCSPWDAKVEFCGVFTSNHLVLMHDMKNLVPQIFDSYDPTRKELVGGSGRTQYFIPYAMKTSITIKEQPQNDMLELVILKGTDEQYILGKDGLAYHIYNEGSLQKYIAAGIIRNVVPTPVDAIRDSGEDFVSLTRK